MSVIILATTTPSPPHARMLVRQTNKTTLFAGRMARRLVGWLWEVLVHQIATCHCYYRDITGHSYIHHEITTIISPPPLLGLQKWIHCVTLL